MFIRVVCVLIVLSLTGVDSEALAQVPEDRLESQNSAWVAARKRRKKRRRKRPRRKRKRKRAVKKKVVVQPAKPEVAPDPTPEPVVEQPAKPAPPKEVAESSPAVEKPGIAVMSVKSVHGVSSGMGDLVNEMILVRLKNGDRFSSVVGGSDMAAMIDLEAQKQALGCAEDSCLAELGGALGVPYMLNASIGKMGTLMVLTVKIIAVEEAKVEVRQILRAKDEGALADGIDGLVDKAVVDLLGQPTAVVAEAESKVAAPAVASASPAADEGDRASGVNWLKWSGATVGLLGVSYTAARQVVWMDAQSEFDRKVSEGVALDSTEVEVLSRQAEQSNVEVGAGLAVSGLGFALMWWGW